MECSAGNETGEVKVRSGGVIPVCTALASISSASPLIDDGCGEYSITNPFLSSARQAIATKILEA